jgi:hypothetical protein
MPSFFASTEAICDLVRTICSEDDIDLRDESILNSFNGVNVEQTDRYIKILCKSYIDKLLAHYGWSAVGSWETDLKPIKPISSSTLQQMFSDHKSSPLDGTPEHAALELAAGFSYRSVRGAFIYAYVVAHPDIGYAVTTLARFSDRPAKKHYNALHRAARYLRMTKSWGLHYWRQQLLPSLPVGMFQPLPSDPSLPSLLEPLQSTLLAQCVDAAHATDLKTRQCTSSCSVADPSHISRKSNLLPRLAPPRSNSLPPSMQPRSPSIPIYLCRAWLPTTRAKYSLRR